MKTSKQHYKITVEGNGANRLGDISKDIALSLDLVLPRGIQLYVEKMEIEDDTNK